MKTMKSYIGFAILAVLLIQVQTNEDEFKCSTFRNDANFDSRLLQDLLEECGAKKTVNDKCPSDYPRWTKCLHEKLKLKKPDCPREKQCIKHLSNMLKSYENRGKKY